MNMTGAEEARHDGARHEIEDITRTSGDVCSLVSWPATGPAGSEWDSHTSGMRSDLGHVADDEGYKGDRGGGDCDNDDGGVDDSDDEEDDGEVGEGDGEGVEDTGYSEDFTRTEKS